MTNYFADCKNGEFRCYPVEVLSGPREETYPDDSKISYYKVKFSPQLVAEGKIVLEQETVEVPVCFIFDREVTEQELPKDCFWPTAEDLALLN